MIAAEGEHKASRALRHAAEVICDSPAALQVIVVVLMVVVIIITVVLIVVVIIIIVLMVAVVLYKKCITELVHFISLLSGWCQYEYQRSSSWMTNHS